MQPNLVDVPNRVDCAELHSESGKATSSSVRRISWPSQVFAVRGGDDHVQRLRDVVCHVARGRSNFFVVVGVVVGVDVVVAAVAAGVAAIVFAGVAVGCCCCCMISSSVSSISCSSGSSSQRQAAEAAASKQQAANKLIYNHILLVLLLMPLMLARQMCGLHAMGVRMVGKLMLRTTWRSGSLPVNVTQ